eukprot:scaffold71042_cov32-Tisochrysis_lutea.AAC.6
MAVELHTTGLDHCRPRLTFVNTQTYRSQFMAVQGPPMRSMLHQLIVIEAYLWRVSPLQKGGWWTEMLDEQDLSGAAKA